MRHNTLRGVVSIRTPRSLRFWRGRRCLSAPFLASFALFWCPASSLAGANLAPEIPIMSDHPQEKPPSESHKRVQPFLDCISYLLAKRWLRDQRQQTAEPPQERPESCDEPSAR
jgi:hypothetical protein